MANQKTYAEIYEELFPRINWRLEYKETLKSIKTFGYENPGRGHTCAKMADRALKVKGITK